MRLQGKVAVVTGAAGGIGAATALRFAAEGAKLVLADLKEVPDALKRDLQARGEVLEYRQCDLSDRDAVIALFADVEALCGRLDILVNVAGGDFGANAAFEDVDEANIRRNMDANYNTTLYCCQQAVKMMKAQGSGAIVNMSSMTFRGSSANQFAYASAKGAVYALTRTLAMTLGKDGIRVNAVAPGMIEVDTIVKTLPEGMWEQVSKAIGATYPLGRVGQPDEVANAILFLASDEASFITGEVLEISGGGRL